jgi:DNA invertase Pin-like site-specific DNA recombinase
MIAAIYARKSTDQSAVADEAKSVRRQIDDARAYAAREGWRSTTRTLTTGFREQNFRTDPASSD